MMLSPGTSVYLVPYTLYFLVVPFSLFDCKLNIELSECKYEFLLIHSVSSGILFLHSISVVSLYLS